MKKILLVLSLVASSSFAADFDVSLAKLSNPLLEQEASKIIAFCQSYVGDTSGCSVVRAKITSLSDAESVPEALKSLQALAFKDLVPTNASSVSAAMVRRQNVASDLVKAMKWVKDERVEAIAREYGTTLSAAKGVQFYSLSHASDYGFVNSLMVYELKTKEIALIYSGYSQ